MADNGKYYYLKVKENFFETDEMKILEGMKDGYIYGNILLKLYLRSLKNEGRLMYRNRIPYTPEILAELVGHEVGTVEKGVYRTLDVGHQNKLSRAITALDEVQIVEVPSELMKTLYDFTQGWKPAGSAKQINMMLINPLAVITPISYEFAKLDSPSALSEGKYVYYEESHEDVFVLANGTRMCMPRLSS